MEDILTFYHQETKKFVFQTKNNLSKMMFKSDKLFLSEKVIKNLSIIKILDVLERHMKGDRGDHELLYRDNLVVSIYNDFVLKWPQIISGKIYVSSNLDENSTTISFESEFVDSY